MSEPETRLILLRHAEVASHRGDVPVTAAGAAHAQRVGAALAAVPTSQPPVLLYGGTRRTRETAQALALGLGREHGLPQPVDSFALRNPDMYLAGVRVDMVSSPKALSEQVPGLSVQDAAGHPWWAGFFSAPDRIGWWLTQSDPPGENGDDLVRRITRFTASLLVAGPTRGRLVVGVTHSPLLRALLRHSSGVDPGEPGYVTGAETRVLDGRLHVTPFTALPPPN